MNNNQSEIRQELVNYLENAKTRASLARATENFPEEFINQSAPNVPYTFWGLLEHIRLVQLDMIDFMANPNYQSKGESWPNPTQQATKQMWEQSVSECLQHIEDLKKIILDPKFDLTAKIPAGSGQTILWEVMQVIDHASYHIGEIVLMRRVLGIWDQTTV